jgi:hypothetical protein
MMGYGISVHVAPRRAPVQGDRYGNAASASSARSTQRAAHLAFRGSGRCMRRRWLVLRRRSVGAFKRGEGLMDALFRRYQGFNRLPFVARRALLAVFFFAVLVFGVKVQPLSDSLAGTAFLVGWVGFVWATGLWIVLRGALVVLVWFLRIYY